MYMLYTLYKITSTRAARHKDSLVIYYHGIYYMLSRISFTLSKTIANEIIFRSAKVNGRQYDQNSTSSANNRFPDSLDIHLEMSR